MTAPSSIDPTRFLHEQLGSASPDLLRQMLTTFMNTLMSAEADAVCGAPYGESCPERTNAGGRPGHPRARTNSAGNGKSGRCSGRSDASRWRRACLCEPGAHITEINHFPRVGVPDQQQQSEHVRIAGTG